MYLGFALTNRRARQKWIVTIIKYPGRSIIRHFIFRGANDSRCPRSAAALTGKPGLARCGCDLFANSKSREHVDEHVRPLVAVGRVREPRTVENGTRCCPSANPQGAN